MPEGTAIFIRLNKGTITLTGSGEGLLLVGINCGEIFINNNEGYVNNILNYGEITVAENENLILIGINNKIGKLMVGNTGENSLLNHTEWIKVESNFGIIEIGQPTKNKTGFTNGNKDVIYITNNKFGASIKIFANDDDIYINQNWGEVEVGGINEYGMQGSNNDRVFITTNVYGGKVLNLDRSDVRIKIDRGTYYEP